jgi:hypothetical protein
MVVEIRIKQKPMVKADEISFQQEHLVGVNHEFPEIQQKVLPKEWIRFHQLSYLIIEIALYINTRTVSAYAISA